MKLIAASPKAAIQEPMSMRRLAREKGMPTARSNAKISSINRATANPKKQNTFDTRWIPCDLTQRWDTWSTIINYTNSPDGKSTYSKIIIKLFNLKRYQFMQIMVDVAILPKILFEILS